MRIVLLVLLALVVFEGSALAQGGYIMLSNDPAGLSCNTTDLNFVYQIHQSSPGTVAVRYKIETFYVNGPVIFLADNYNPWSAVGSSEAGVTVVYGTCQSSPVFIGFSIYSAPAAQPCDFIYVVPDPAAPSRQVESVDCSLPIPITYAAGRRLLTIDPAGGHACIPRCDSEAPPPPVPVRRTHWGRIKALYE